MAFYLSMGVSLAVEDAVSLATVLDLACPNPSTTPDAGHLKTALSVFEDVRKARASAVQKASLRGGNSYHIPEGKERDALHRVMSHANDIVEVSLEDLDDGVDLDDEFSCAVGGMMNRKTRDWCYGYDAVGDVTAAWNSRAG